MYQLKRSKLNMLLQLSQRGKFISLLVILNFIGLVSWQTPLQANESYYRVVEVAEWDVLNIRITPNHRSKKLGHIFPNELCVLVIGEGYAKNDVLWFRVNYNNIVGWVNSYYMAPSSYCD